MTEHDERDRVEGRYTQAEPEAAESREVHGKYTMTAEHPGPEGDIVGAYVGTQRDGSEPLVRSSHLRSGNYPKAEHESHDPGKHQGRAKRDS